MTENDAIAKFKRTSVLWESATNTEMVEAVKVAIQALEIVAKMKEHCEGSCTDCPYWNPKFDKCMNDLLKGAEENG